MEPNSGGRFWEKIYFEITEVHFYSKKSKSHPLPRPRKFKGKAMSTYRSDENYVSTGEIISFWRKNILEIPGWKSDEVGPLSDKQHNKKLIAQELSCPPKIVGDDDDY